MAAVTILNAASADVTGSGVAITGDFEVQAFGNFLGGQAYLERSIADVAGQYSLFDVKTIFSGPGWAVVKNTGTSYYRVRLIGVKTDRGTPSITVKAIQ